MNVWMRDSLIVLGITAALVVTAACGVYLPQSRKLDSIRSDVASQKLTLESEAHKASVVPQMVRQIQAMRSRQEDFDRRLPKQKELGGFLKEISENLEAEHMSNQLIEPGTPLQEKLYNTLPIVMRFRGSYMSLVKFLERVDKMERLTRVQKLTIAPDPKEQVLDVTLYMNIYFTEG